MVRLGDNVNQVFDRNDFDIIYAKYFEDIIANGSAVADPSGWAQTETEVRTYLPPSPAPSSLSSYIIDNRLHIASQKEVLISLLQKWDCQKYEFDEITITPSISSASFAVLLMLRRNGVRTVFFETPAYYVTIEQAASIGIRICRIPTYYSDQYAWDPARLHRRSRSPVAVWLTQPRFALGLDQRHEHIVSLLQYTKSNDFIIIDETADQRWPTSLSNVKLHQGPSNIIKIRGYTKPLGLNGLRLSFIIHSAGHRSALQELQWTVGAALDYYSLAAAVQIASDPALFRSMLSAARNRILATYRRLSVLAFGKGIGLSAMENGYLGSATVDWSPGRGTYANKRQSLLEHCREWKLPVTLGSAMLFAHDPLREHVRLNYFMSTLDLEFCIQRLAQFRAAME